jgi:predicted Ser/Thr protein kinase
MLVGRYERRRWLGAGGMGQVYEGHDRLLNRPVAVKTLHAQFAHEPVRVGRLVREATAAARLNHPNVVAVYDAGSDENTHFIVMEYVPGRTLREVLDEQGPLAPERAATFASDIAAALASAHARGLVHRDVKPGNVMVTPTGDVKVVDFGIARATDGAPVTQTAGLAGTPMYLAPEQVQGDSPDVRSDLYALGVCLYELLTGVPPFTADNAVALAYLHVHEEPQPPRQLRPDLPPALEAVVLKAMAKDPDARYQTAAAMRADLERAIADRTPASRSILARRAGALAVTRTDGRRAAVTAPQRGQPARAWARHTRFLAFAVAALLLGGLAAVLPLELTRDGQRAAEGTRQETGSLTVPYLRGLTLEAAQARLRRMGFERPPAIRQQADPAVPRGRVLGTDPPADTRIVASARVTLTVSSGPARADRTRDSPPEPSATTQPADPPRSAGADSARGTGSGEKRKETGKEKNEGKGKGSH